MSRSKGPDRLRRSLVLAAAVLGGIGTGCAGGGDVGRRASPEADAFSGPFVAAARAAKPSVAQLQVTRLVHVEDPFDEIFGPEFRRRFFGGQPEDRTARETATGSGVIIDSSGVILTSAHVVQQARAITAKLPDGRIFHATSFRSDDEHDLAVVKIEGKGLPVARLGDSDALEVGQWVLAIGNPFGLEHTVTAGVVSAVHRRTDASGDGADLIQTDAAINPGNSGGPLIDLRGQVVGINTSIYSQNGGYQGIGFALPINLARTVMKKLMEAH